MQISVCLYKLLLLTSSTFCSPSGFVEAELSDDCIKGNDWRRTVETDAGGMRNIRNPRGGRQPKKGKISQSVWKVMLSLQKELPNGNGKTFVEPDPH